MSLLSQHVPSSWLLIPLKYFLGPKSGSSLYSNCQNLPPKSPGLLTSTYIRPDFPITGCTNHSDFSLGALDCSLSRPPKSPHGPEGGQKKDTEAQWPFRLQYKTILECFCPHTTVLVQYFH